MSKQVKECGKDPLGSVMDRRKEATSVAGRAKPEDETHVTPERLDYLFANIVPHRILTEGEAADVALAVRELQSSREELTRLRELEAAVREAGSALDTASARLDFSGAEKHHAQANQLRRLRSLVAKPTEQEPSK